MIKIYDHNAWPNMTKYDQIFDPNFCFDNIKSTMKNCGWKNYLSPPWRFFLKGYPTLWMVASLAWKLAEALQYLVVSSFFGKWQCCIYCFGVRWIRKIYNSQVLVEIPWWWNSSHELRYCSPAPQPSFQFPSRRSSTPRGISRCWPTVEQQQN